MRLKKFLFAFEVFIIFLCLTFYIWYTVANNDRQRQLQTTEINANQLKNGIESFVSERVSVLLQVRNFWLNSGAVTHEQFLSFCREIIGQVPGFQSIEYENTRTRDVWSEPFLKTELLDKSNAELENIRQGMLRHAVREKTVQVTPPLQYSDGSKGFYAIVPVFRGAILEGSIYGFFNTDTVFDLIFDTTLRERYHCIIVDEKQPIFSTEGVGIEDLKKARLRVEKTLELRNRNWKLTLWPKEFRDQGGYLGVAVLIFGVALSAVLGSLVWVLSSKAELAEVYGAMLETSQTLSASTDLNTVLRTTGEACLRMTGVNRCCVFLWDSGGRQFEPAWISSDLESILPKFMQFRPRYGESLLIDKLVDEKRSLVLSKPESLASFSPSFVSKYQVKSLLVVPLVSKNSLVGAITLDQVGTRHRFSSREQVMVEGVSTHAVTAIENAQLLGQFQKQSDLVSKKNKELESLLSVVSMDLKGPLLALGGMAQLLRDDCGEHLSESGRHYLQKIQDKLVQMESLIGNVLEFTRIARDVEPMEQIAVPELLDEVLSHLQTQRNGHTVHLVNQNEAQEIWFSRNGLRQIFKNLIDNAIKFSCYQEDAEVVIGSKAIEGESCFFVSDNGIGIDSQHHESIFDLFHRLEELRGAEGAGVGLAIVRRVLDIYGGRVWLESEKGKGTTFFFTIPNRPAST